MMLVLAPVMSRSLIEIAAGDLLSCNSYTVCAAFERFLYKQQLVIYKQTAGCWITVVKKHSMKAFFFFFILQSLC